MDRSDTAMRRLPQEDDDDPRVFVAAGVEALLDPDEGLLLRARPSPRHAWADSDPLQPVRAKFMQATSRPGRVAVRLLCAALLGLFTAAGVALGATALDPGENIGVANRVALVLLACVLGSTAALGLRPLLNAERARRLEYLVSDRRAWVVRRGPAWGEWLATAPLRIALSVSMLAGGATGLAGQCVAAVKILGEGETGFGATLALLGVGLLFFPIFLGLIGLGAVFLQRVGRELRSAIAERHAIFARDFPFAEIARSRCPRVERLRRNGVGDVVLDIDSSYQSDPDSGGGSTLMSEVGFLSVPGAETLAAQLREQIEKA